MLRVWKIRVEDIENPGCNNGNYPRFYLEFENGAYYYGRTCNCERGCSNTSRLPHICQEFKDWQEFVDYMHS